MNKLKHRLAQAWQLCRELSGEAAFERRMQAFPCKNSACAAKAALTELASERSRCC